LLVTIELAKWIGRESKEFFDFKIDLGEE